MVTLPPCAVHKQTPEPRCPNSATTNIRNWSARTRAFAGEYFRVCESARFAAEHDRDFAPAPSAQPTPSTPFEHFARRLQNLARAQNCPPHTRSQQLHLRATRNTRAASNTSVAPDARTLAMSLGKTSGFTRRRSVRPGVHRAQPRRCCRGETCVTTRPQSAIAGLKFNDSAVKVLAFNGWLLSCRSCSFHISKSLPMHPMLNAAVSRPRSRRDHSVRRP